MYRPDRMCVALVIVSLLTAPWLAVACTSARAETPGHLLRYPDIHGDAIVFTCEGDLWLGSLSRGTAQRLTTDEGDETLAHFSPDGRQIAFTAQYDGNADVYVMPVDGGMPKRLTWSPRGVATVGWTPNGADVVFVEMDAYPWATPHLYTVAAGGGPARAVPIGQAGQSSFSPDGTKVAYTPYPTENGHWKRYQGGWSNDIWIADLGRKTFQKVTDWAGQDEYPVWAGDRVFFTSDRDGNKDLYCYDPASGQTKRCTTHQGFDVKWLGTDGKSVIYQVGPGLEVFDVASGQTHPVNVAMPTDRIHTRPQVLSASKWMRDFAIGPTGKRAVIVSRGQMATIPAEHGDIRPLAVEPGTRAQAPAWSPDGKRIAFVSDRGGEQQVCVVSATEETEKAPRALTSLEHAWPSGLVWSPDGKKIAFTAQDLQLYVVSTGEKPTLTKVASARWSFFSTGFQGYDFSPDSRYLAFSRVEANPLMPRCDVFLYDTRNGETHPVTTGPSSSYSPAFDPSGQYLYFLSDRNIQARFGIVDFDMSFDKTTKAYLAVLAKDGESPFLQEDDEEGAPAEEEGNRKESAATKPGKAAGKNRKANKAITAARAKAAVKPKAAAKPKQTKESEQAEEPAPTKIDWEGLADRVVEFPAEARWYTSVVGGDGKVFLASYSNAPEGPQTLQVFDLKEKTTETVVKELTGFTVSHDRKKILVRNGDAFQIVDADGKDLGPTDGKLDLSGWQMTVDPAAEWRQIFEETWRRERDFLYDPHLQQIDWNAVHARYSALLPSIGSRGELTDVLGEMIAELNVSHAFVGGGETRYHPAAVAIGCLGADLAPDPESGYYRITRILRGDGFDPATVSPLAAPGLKVREGDYLLRIAGRPVRLDEDPDALLAGLGGRVVALTVNDKPSTKGARQVRIEVMKSDAAARYADWVAGRRAYVQKKDPRIAYLHLPDMQSGGLNEFTKQYFASLDKDAMIIDVRYNQGGIVAPIILDRLQRTVVDYYAFRHGETAYEHPSAFPGHLAVVINQQTMSDGEVFTEQFRRIHRGPIVGSRTWGGVVGIAAYELVDGGMVTAPGAALWTPERTWHVEGVGSIPDIAVQNDPASTLAGEDRQLDRAIEALQQELKDHPIERPKPPDFEDRSGLKHLPVTSPAR